MATFTPLALLRGLFLLAGWAWWLLGDGGAAAEWARRADLGLNPFGTEPVPEWLERVPPSNRGAVLRMNDRERRLYLDYRSVITSLYADPDEGTRAKAFEAAEVYVAAAAPCFPRDVCLWNLAKERLKAADPAGALEYYRTLMETGDSRNLRIPGRKGYINTLLKMDRRAEAEVAIRAIPQHGVGGLRNTQDISDAADRSRFLVKIGQTEEAQQSFLSQSPPPGDREAVDSYLNSAHWLAADISLRAEPREALGFHLALMKKHPRVVTPQFLSRVYKTADQAGDVPVRDFALDAALTRYPDAPGTAWLALLAASDAAGRGDRAAAELLYRRAAESAGAGPRERADAADRLRALGVSVDPAAAPAAPVPDPAFARPAGGDPTAN